MNGEFHVNVAERISIHGSGFANVAEKRKGSIVPLRRVSRKKTESADAGPTDSRGGRKVRGQALNPLLYPNLENKRVRAPARKYE